MNVSTCVWCGLVAWWERGGYGGEGDAHPKCAASHSPLAESYVCSFWTCSISVAAVTSSSPANYNRKFQIMASKLSLAAFACATFLPCHAVRAVDITTPTTIYTGDEYGGAVIDLSSRLRYGTVGTSATLTSPINLVANASSTISATDSSTLTFQISVFAAGHELTLGSVVDTGTVEITRVGGGGLSGANSFRVAGGTAVVFDNARFVVAMAGGTTVDEGATLVLDGPSDVYRLKGSGRLDASGDDLYLIEPNFFGEIRNVDTLTAGGGSLEGTLVNVNRLAVADGSILTLNQSGVVNTIAEAVGNLSSVSVGDGSQLQFGLFDLTLNNLSGLGVVRGIGDLTINGGSFDGTLESAQDVIFTGTSRWLGNFISARSVIVEDGASLTFGGNIPMTGDGIPVEINGVLATFGDWSLGAITGDGHIRAAVDLIVGVGGASSQFDGFIEGSNRSRLVKTGAGTLTLGQTSSLDADVRVDEGSLVIATLDAAGDIENNASVVFDLGAADDTYGGALSGSGTFTKLGTGILTLSGSNTLSGTFEVFGGGLLTNGLGLQGDVVNNATVTFDELSAGTYASTMSGTGALVKTGAGSLNWTGTGTFSGGTEVEEGLLSVNGNLSGLVTVDDGAALGGSGTVGAFDALSGATIAPGNSIGTLTVAGDADFAAGSVYDVEVDGLGNADLIDVGGVLTVSSDATVSVGPENGTDTGIDYASPLTYTIATAAGGVSGTFGSVADSFAFLDSSLSYDANNIYLTLTRLSFPTDPGNDNEGAVGEAIDSLPSGPVTDALLGVTDDERADALRDLSGEIHASIGQGLVDSVGVLRNGILSELAAPQRGRYWSIAQGLHSHFEADTVSSEGRMSGGGVLFGGDILYGEGLALGIMAGYDHLGMTLPDRQSEASVDSVSLGTYGLLDYGPTALRFGGLYSWHAIDSERDVDFSSLDERLTADYRGSTVQGFAEASYAVEIGETVLEPYLGGALVYGRQSEFSETGGAAALSGAAEDQFSAYGMVGLRLRHELMLGERKVRLHGQLGMQHLLYGDRSAAVLAFDGSDNFRVEGKGAAQNAGVLKFGISTEIAAGADFSLSYDARLGEGDSLHSVKAGLRVAF
ncbi:autotransporter-associated beta strand protein [Rhizobium rosettiformans]|uniref:Autotransporter-associated beta strand protein n=1 Tax=Rhizobium rosettiformans TaxID=1368430 RepID=A0A7W8MDD9_9HYPH|nr:autotransporter domain-containing protein [Rhizobium rosettiformans]MBB5276732.1 autotransporter-associated beta strand protein [Rhizobium rosettiformans]